MESDLKAYYVPQRLNVDLKSLELGDDMKNILAKTQSKSFNLPIIHILRYGWD